MKLRFLFLAFLSGIVVAQAGDLPQVRPALIGTAPDAIINQINTKMLIAKGQQNGALMFCAAVNREGMVIWNGVIGASAKSGLLETEMRRVLEHAKMVPAIRNGQPTSVLFYGTLTFRVVDGKSRLRIFSNQEPKEVEAESDFIGPQPCLPGDTFYGFQYPESQTAVPVDAAVNLSLKIDAAGNVTEAGVVSEDPPLLGFGQAAMLQFGKSPFIPGFRNGKPTACEVTLPVYYRPVEDTTESPLS